MNTQRLSLTRSELAPGGPQVLHLIGPLVMSTTADFQKWLRAEPAHSVILDFTEVPFIDSSGLGALIAIFMHFKNTGRRLVLTCLNEKCHALLKMSNVEQFFPKFDSVEDACKGLA